MRKSLVPARCTSIPNQKNLLPSFDLTHMLIFELKPIA